MRTKFLDLMMGEESQGFYLDQDRRLFNREDVKVMKLIQVVIERSDLNIKFKPEVSHRHFMERNPKITIDMTKWIGHFI